MTVVLDGGMNGDGGKAIVRLVEHCHMAVMHVRRVEQDIEDHVWL